MCDSLNNMIMRTGDQCLKKKQGHCVKVTQEWDSSTEKLSKMCFIKRNDENGAQLPRK